MRAQKYQDGAEGCGRAGTVLGFMLHDGARLHVAKRLMPFNKRFDLQVQTTRT